MLRLAPWLTLAIMLGPVIAGLLATLAPAFGYLPAIGGRAFTLAPWRALFATPGLAATVALTLVTGVGATILALGSVMLLCAAGQGTRAFAVLRSLLSPLLSVPHAATAFALAFLIAPSGWILRSISPWATGLHRPPDLLLVHDLNGLSLMAGLVVKEIPFLLLMTLAALGQIDAPRRLVIARTLGYGQLTGWFKAVFPGIYPQIRLPLFAVLAYSLSVVDMALILGPTNPPTLAVSIIRWTTYPDLDLRFQAAAGAVLLLLLVLAAIAAWLLAEKGVRAIGHGLTTSGRRGGGPAVLRPLAALPSAASAAVVLAGMLALAIWSLARSWRFPAALPEDWTLANWVTHLNDAGYLVGVSAAVAAIAALIATVLAVASLENEATRAHVPRPRLRWLIYLPLLIPQVSFLFGLQMLLVALRLDGTLTAVVWAHLVFVVPYVFLALSDPYRAFDKRYTLTALCLRAGRRRAFWSIKLPMMLRAIMTAAAVGFAISVGQYLPTLFAGAGRITSITTEAVALAASFDRRIIGLYAFLQAVLPFLGFAAALAVPALAFRSRRAMQVR